MLGYCIGLMKGNEMMKNWNPVDFVVFALAVVVAGALSITAFESVVYKMPLSTEKAAIVDRIYIGVLAIVSLYVGARVGGNNKKDER